MKRIYCLALVMSLAVGCESDDGSEGTAEAVVTDESCSSRYECPAYGRCTAASDGSSCIVTDESCRVTEYCDMFGLCTATSDGSRCIATNESCRASSSCALWGECALSSDGSECIDISSLIGIDWVTLAEFVGDSFQMGSEDSEYPELTSPVHSVRVSPFVISTTEVTVAQYRACVDQGWCSEPNTGDYCNWNVEGRENHPINCVDWGQARTFAKWIGPDVDLLTEAQWEYAARGGQDFIYAGSNNLDEVAWYDENSGDSTRPVGKKQANGYGLYDMSGNVWEWVLDEGHHNYEGAPTVSDEARGEVPECAQVCDNGSAERMIRGGGFLDSDPDPVGYRVPIRVSSAHDDLGFRLRGSRLTP